MNAKQLKEQEAEDAIARGVYNSLNDRPFNLRQTLDGGNPEGREVRFHGDLAEQLTFATRTVHNLRRKGGGL